MTKKRPLRILFNTNAPWSTSGYGTQARDLLPLMQKAGYEIGIVCFYGLEGGIIKVNDITCYPKLGDTWGGDAVVEHQKHFNADVVMTLQDIWVLQPQHVQQFRRWIPIVPIDHDPAPPPVLERLRAAYRIITYSDFGYKELKKNGLLSTYIPHTVDTQTLKPQDKKEARKILGIPDDIYLFGMVAANKDNPPRKSFQHAMDAFKLFHEKHPNSGMYFHTIVNQAGGFPIDEYAKFLGIEKAIYKIPPYDMMFNVNRDVMAQIYSTFDCLLLPSTNEGFGVPAIEAQACGVPVIVNNFTSMPELVTPDTGLVCETAQKRFSPLGSYVAYPDIESLYQNMERIFSRSPEKMAESCRNFAVENYDINKVFTEKWLPFLKKLEAEILA